MSTQQIVHYDHSYDNGPLMVLFHNGGAELCQTYM